MTKKRFIKKCMSCGFSRNEARLICEYVQKLNKKREKHNRLAKKWGFGFRFALMDYGTSYLFRNFCLTRLKNTQEIETLSNGTANGKRATVTNIDEMHTYRKEDHEKETVY